MTKKFTPGPWHFEPCNIGSEKNRYNPIVTHEGGNVARIFADVAMPGLTSKAPDLETAEANARLIAAAPDLLEACKVTLKALDAEWGGEATDGDNTVRHAMRAAIAKATKG